MILFAETPVELSLLSVGLQFGALGILAIFFLYVHPKQVDKMVLQVDKMVSVMREMLTTVLTVEGKTREDFAKELTQLNESFEKRSRDYSDHLAGRWELAIRQQSEVLRKAFDSAIARVLERVKEDAKKQQEMKQ